MKMNKVEKSHVRKFNLMSALGNSRTFKVAERTGKHQTEGLSLYANLF